MNDIIPIMVIGSIVILTIFFLFLRLFYFPTKSGKAGKGRKKNKDRAAVIKEANKRLSQNPKDPEALDALADAYYTGGEVEKAFKTYNILLNLVAMNPDLNESLINMRYGLCAMKLENYEEAYKSLTLARAANQTSFEINNNLGILEYKRKNYEKAAALLRQASLEKPDVPETAKYLGHCLFKLKKYKDSIIQLRKAIDQEPDDKESLFALAQSYYEQKMNDKALKIFSHLRPDPVMGPHAALMAGTINLQTKQYPKAILDFEIGIRHKNLKKEIAMEIRYRLANAYTHTQELGKAISLLREIKSVNPEYKDIEELLKKYSELHSNKNLQIYLMAPTSEFITLCRKITNSLFLRSRIKILDINVVGNEYADILAEVSTAKWEDTILLRYVRTTGQIGELFLRELNARIKDLRAGRGFCMSPGTFSDGAKRFVEARLIDLVEKSQLMKTLQKAERF